MRFRFPLHADCAALFADVASVSEQPGADALPYPLRLDPEIVERPDVALRDDAGPSDELTTCVRDVDVGRTERLGREVAACSPRSEEHTSELQSLRHLVCR